MDQWSPSVCVCVRACARVCVFFFVSLSLIKCNKNPLHLRVARTGQTKKQSQDNCNYM